jgi:hypothetical protein
MSTNIRTFLAVAVAAVSATGLNSQASAAISPCYADQNALLNWTVIAPAVPKGNVDGVSGAKTPLIRVAPTGPEWSPRGGGRGKG